MQNYLPVRIRAERTFPNMRTAIDLEQAFTTHYSDVVGFCRRRVRPGDVDEIVGDVFTELWRKAVVVEPESLRAWLFGVARHKIWNHHRAHRRRAAAEARLTDERSARSHPDPAGSVAERSAVEEAASRLSLADRELLELLSWEGLSPSELAVVLDCTVDAANVRVHRMRKRLLDHLADLDVDPSPSNQPPPSADRTHL